MTPQERQLVDDLFGRLSSMESAPRDPDASASIAQGLRLAPNAVYALVQTVLVQDEALKRANSRIQELEAAGAPQPTPSGGFLDPMRESLGQGHGSVPNVRPPEIPSRPVWNTGELLQQTQSPGQYDQGPYGRDQGPYGQSYGQPYGAQQAPMGGGGGSFLGTAASMAAGAVGGSLLLGGIRSMMGGSHHGFGDASGLGGKADSPKPLTDLSGSTLARDAGIDHIGGSGARAEDGSRKGLLDTALNDHDHDDADDDSDDDGDDGGSDTA
jgi:hypothetical protein